MEGLSYYVWASSDYEENPTRAYGRLTSDGSVQHSGTRNIRYHQRLRNHTFVFINLMKSLLTQSYFNHHAGNIV